VSRRSPRRATLSGTKHLPDCFQENAILDQVIAQVAQNYLLKAPANFVTRKKDNKSFCISHSYQKYPCQGGEKEQLRNLEKT